LKGNELYCKCFLDFKVNKKSDFKKTLITKKIETKNITLIDQKSMILQIQGVKGEAVVIYCEPLTTLEMGYHRLLIN